MTDEGNIYICARCGDECEKAWSDEEADAEFATNFPNCLNEPRELICDDCYKDFMKWFRPLRKELVEGRQS